MCVSRKYQPKKNHKPKFSQPKNYMYMKNPSDEKLDFTESFKTKTKYPRKFESTTSYFNFTVRKLCFETNTNYKF